MEESETEQLLQEKRKRRKEQNRINARECRRRKKEQMNRMEKEIEVLEKENIQMRLQLKVGEEAKQELIDEEEKFAETLQDMLKAKKSESDIAALLDQYKLRFGDFAAERRATVEYHLESIGKLLLPNQKTAFAINALHACPVQRDSSGISPSSEACIASDIAKENISDKSAAQTKKSISFLTSTSTHTKPQSHSDCARKDTVLAPPSDIFSCLARHLELTHQQAAELQQFRGKDLSALVDEPLKALAEMQTCLKIFSAEFENELDRIKAGPLEPSQMAKFIVWVHQNPAVTFMLNEYWESKFPLVGHESGALSGEKNEKDN